MTKPNPLRNGDGKLRICKDSRVAVCHEEARGFLFLGDCVFCNYVGDEGGPLEADLQEQASNHLKLLW